MPKRSLFSAWSLVCLVVVGFSFTCFAFTTPRTFTRSLTRGTSLSATEQYQYECECKEQFANEKAFQRHIHSTRHFDGKFSDKVLNKCRLVVAGKTALLAEVKFVCECNEQFVDKRLLQSHISKSGHFNGLYNADVLKKCTLLLVAAPRQNVIGSPSSLSSTKATKVSKEGTTIKGAVQAPAHPETLQKLSAFISGSETEKFQGGNALADAEHMPVLKESTLLGTLVGSSIRNKSKHENENKMPQSVESENQQWNQQQVFLNTHEPFCLVTVGVQGGGKSHTLATVLEGCLIPFPEHNLSRLEEPMTTLVLHYDESAFTKCEATGLRFAAPKWKEILGDKVAGRCVGKERITILVSANYYKQRLEFYKGSDYNIKPLLLRWETLSANQIKCIMGIKDTDTQLYVSTMLNLLKRYQREKKMPSAPVFFKEVRVACNIAGQGGPLVQRLALLESLIAESDINKKIKDTGSDLYAQCAPGRLVIADMTDPLLSKSDVNGVFQVLVEQYRTLPNHPGSGRLLALDEAHKYMDGAVTDGLSAAIVNIVRQMRHDGIRLVVGTQSPRALAPELLELVTVGVIHRFHSMDWFNYLKAKIPLEDAAWSRIRDLYPGEALVFASRHQIGVSGKEGTTPFGQNIFEMKIRPRLTTDVGGSLVNKQSSKTAKK